MIEEIREHLQGKIIPFWESLRDDEYGGYYGYRDFNLKTDKKAVKGCILNSRIIWFFANAAMLFRDEKLLENAGHGYRFLKEHFLDHENGGVFWSVKYDGQPEDTMKHTYAQAFAVYALASYYDASKDGESLRLALELADIMERKCRDEEGYLEAFDLHFQPSSNEKLSENGVMAARTMNTLLHVFEAYTELYRVSGSSAVKEKMEWILEIFADKIYNPRLHRQEVFFDREYHSLIDLYSYGHDIEAAWLIDRGTEILGEQEYTDRMTPITKDLTAMVYKTAFDGHSLAQECEKGIVNEDRVWWVQAEAVNGFLNGYQHDKSRTEYLQAAGAEWKYIKEKMIDPRENSEWYWLLDKNGRPYPEKPIVEPWKCPYHNGRMCMEVIRRNIDVT